MNVKEAINTRKATRAMLPDSISDTTIRELIETAGRTPSWANSQPWEVYIVTGEKLESLKMRWKKECAHGMPPARPDVPAPSCEGWKVSPKIVENMTRWKEHRLHEMNISSEQHDKDIMDSTLIFFGAPVCVYLGLHKSLSPYSFYDVGAYSQTLMLAVLDVWKSGVEYFGYTWSSTFSLPYQVSYTHK